MELLKSKKFQVMGGGILIVALCYLIGIPESGCITISGLLMTYIGAQGLSDFGKEAAKVETNGTSIVEIPVVSQPETPPAGVP